MVVQKEVDRTRDYPGIFEICLTIKPGIARDYLTARIWRKAYTCAWLEMNEFFDNLDIVIKDYPEFQKDFVESGANTKDITLTIIDSSPIFVLRKVLDEEFERQLEDFEKENEGIHRIFKPQSLEIRELTTSPEPLEEDE